jgi:hypothetical protein
MIVSDTVGSSVAHVNRIYDLSITRSGYFSYSIDPFSTIVGWP